jgi:hypothetical protein
MVDQEKEIHSLSAETLAIQAVLVHVLRRLAKSDAALWKAIVLDSTMRQVRLRTLRSNMAQTPCRGTPSKRSASSR